MTQILSNDIDPDHVIYINGVPRRFRHKDLDGDGQIGGVEGIHMQSDSMMGVPHESEAKDLIQEMNRADIDPTTGITELAKMSRIDHIGEEDGLVKLHTLATNGMFPKDICMAVIWAKLSMAISRKGLGRGEAVTIGTDIKKKDEKTGIMAKLMPKKKLKNENTN